MLATRSGGIAGEAFNVGTSESVVVAELVREVTELDSDIVHVDWRARNIEPTRSNVTRLNDVVGFEAGVSLRAGLANLAE